jgi:eukaryotic-like serine/threonine-protein kinase
MPAPRGRSSLEARALTQSKAYESFPASGLQALSQQPLQVPFAVGDVIAGKYEVVGLLGSGGMGYVISARHSELGEMVALKFLRPEALAHPELVERFAREARAAAKIRSDHIAHVFDVGTLSDGTPYIVMEYLAGKDLADYLHEEGPLPVSVAVEYVMQACEALAAAHAHGIVHRDIKPENLFLTRQAQGMNTIKVLDFGISKAAMARAGKRDLVRTQMALGSPVYMSPEQIRRSDEVDSRSDIWAIGCVLFELLTGVTAFDEPSLLELSAAILEREPVPIQTLRPEVSEELEAVVLRCLRKKAEERYQNVAELAAALYPFGPRRARISAERCYHILKNSGLLEQEPALASVAPPPSEVMRVTRGAVPGNLARTTTPAALDIPAELGGAATPAFRSRSRLPLVLGLAAVVAGGAFVALKLKPETGSVAPVAGTPITTAAPAASPGVTGLSDNTPTLDLDREMEDQARAGSAQAPVQSARARAASKAAKVPKLARPAVGAEKRPRGDDELDPGF